MIFVPLTNRNSYRQQSVEESSPFVDTNCRRTFTEDIRKYRLQAQGTGKGRAGRREDDGEGGKEGI
jgi:hypothetical protein